MAWGSSSWGLFMQFFIIMIVICFFNISVSPMISIQVSRIKWYFAAEIVQLPRFRINWWAPTRVKALYYTAAQRLIPNQSITGRFQTTTTSTIITISLCQVIAALLLLWNVIARLECSTKVLNIKTIKVRSFAFLFEKRTINLQLWIAFPRKEKWILLLERQTN